MNNNQKPEAPKTAVKFILAFVLAFALIWALEGGLTKALSESVEVDFSQMVEYFDKEQVTEVRVSASGKSYEGTLKDGSHFTCSAPSDYDMAVITEKYLVPQAAENGLKVVTVRSGMLLNILGWLPTILMVVMMVLLYRSFMKGGAGGQGMMNFGKNKAQMVKDENKVTFKDVAGLDEEKKELAEVVDFLKFPKKYLDLGARIPKGILLVGPPGTGKTFISKAVAGEAGVPFFSISGSDFVEMFVGVGASRVRDLFEDAKKNSPCIVFIDEIDAVGRRRGAGIGGGNDEREQTLNQLLVEMDGFSENQGIIVLAATNRPDVLDPAILRPGRFDRQITISSPDLKGREEVFKVHSKNKILGDDIDIAVLARRTPGFTPADIENMMNEAALLTARRNGSAIHMDDIEEAITRVIAGPKKTSRIITDEERKLTAFHEAGHAVVMRSIPGCDPVHQVTIMPRGSAGGFTMSLPEEDKYFATKGEMLNDICHLLAGRVSESLTLDDISTGASNDLERATKIAHDMVAKYGMTEAIGPINYSDADEVFLGRDFTSKQNFSEELAARIDAEVRKILDECYARTEKILKEHMEELNRIANALLELETIDKDEFEALYTGSRTVEDLKADKAEKEAVRKEKEAKEAAAKAKRDAASAKRAQEKIKELSAGKRIIVYDKNGMPVVIDPSKDAPKEEAVPEEPEAPSEEEMPENDD